MRLRLRRSERLKRGECARLGLRRVACLAGGEGADAEALRPGGDVQLGRRVGRLQHDRLHRPRHALACVLEGVRHVERARRVDEMVERAQHLSERIREHRRERLAARRAADRRELGGAHNGASGGAPRGEATCGRAPVAALALVGAVRAQLVVLEIADARVGRATERGRGRGTRGVKGPAEGEGRGEGLGS